MTRKLVKVPDVRTITLGHFRLHATGMDVVGPGRPTFDEYVDVGEFIKRASAASGWWLGDWLRYGETREDWKQRLSQAQDATGLSEKTLKNRRAIAGSVPPSRRREDIEIGHHDVVAAMEPDEQVHWLGRAATEGWDVRELRLEVRAASRRKIIEGQAVLEGKYRIIYADSPWIYGDRPPSGSGAQQHYPGMTIEQLCALPVAAHSTPDAILFLWATAPLLLANPGPREVGEAWGFTYKQQWIWDKVDSNFGHYSQGNHEVLTIWTRGSCLPDNPTDLPDSVVTVRKSHTHSEKPEEFRKLIEKHWTTGPYLELFGRARREGWSVFGNDAALWADQAAAIA